MQYAVPKHRTALVCSYTCIAGCIRWYYVGVEGGKKAGSCWGKVGVFQVLGFEVGEPGRASKSLRGLVGELEARRDASTVPVTQQHY